MTLTALVASKIVHIVDDDESIRRAISFTLKKVGYSTISWADARAFVDQADLLREGCILLDIRMPMMDGVEAQQSLLAAGCIMPVVMMTGHGDIATAVKTMKAGAIDFIEKPFDRDVLLSVIERAFERIERAHELDWIAEEAALKVKSLTAREQEVLRNLALGLPNKTIAYDLGISTRTVEVHRANVMMKLGVRSFPAALRIAFAAGLGA